MLPELARHQVELERLCREYRVQRLDLFGSAASGGYARARATSTFLVEFEALAEGAYADVMTP